MELHGNIHVTMFSRLGHSDGMLPLASSPAARNQSGLELSESCEITDGCVSAETRGDGGPVVAARSVGSQM